MQQVRSSLLLAVAACSLTACVVSPPRVYVQPAYVQPVYVAPAPRVVLAPAPAPYVVVTPPSRRWYREGYGERHEHGWR